MVLQMLDTKRFLVKDIVLRIRIPKGGFKMIDDNATKGCTSMEETADALNMGPHKSSNLIRTVNFNILKPKLFT